MSGYTPEQFDRLPKWAQLIVNSAERKTDYANQIISENEDLRARLEADSAQAALDGAGRVDWRGLVVAVRNPYDPNPAPVARERDHIRFYLTEDHNRREWVDVALRNGAVEIQAERGVLIRARSSNTFEVRLDDR